MSQFLMPPDETRETAPQAQNSSFLMPPDGWDLASDGKAKALSNLRTLSEANPDQAAADAAMGRKLDMPRDMVGMDRQAAQQQLVEQAIHQLDGGPLQDWLGDPYNLGISVDDLSALQGVAGSLASSGIGVGKSAVKTVGKFPGQLAEGFYQTLGFGAGAVDWLESTTAQGLQFTGITGGQRTGAFGWLRDWAQGHADVIRKGYLESDLLSLPEELKGRLWDNPEYLLSPEYLTYQTGDALNSFITMLAGGAGVSLAKSGTVTADVLRKSAAFFGGAMEGGDMYAGLVKEGVPNERALSGSIAFGAVVGMLEKIGLDKILEGPAGKGLSRAIGRRLLAGGTEAATEYAEEPAQAILSGLARGDAPEKILADFFDSLTNVDVIPGAFLMGGGMRHASDRIQAASRGEAHHARMNRAIDAGEQSKTRARDANAYEQYAASVLPEDMQRQYIDANALQTFFQSAAGEDAETGFTERLGIDDMEFQHAIETGGVVGMDTAKFLSHLTPEQQRQLLPDLKADPLALSQREVSGRDLAAEARQQISSYAPDLARAEEYASERSRMVKNLTDAGREQALAEADAELLAARAITWEKMYGREAFDGVESLRRMEFARGEDGQALEQSNRGAVSFMDDGRTIVTLFQGNDASTVMHEAGHTFLRDMESMATMDNAPEALRRDWVIAREYLGLVEGEALTAEAHEKFARSFEAYLREGQSPSFELSRVLHNFRTWLVDLYKHVRNLGVELTPEIRGVFDRMLANDEQLAETAAMSRMAIDEGKRLAALRGEMLDGLSPADMVDLDRAYEDAHRAATNAMDRASLREFNKRRREALEEARSMVDSDPVYMAAATIRKNPDKAFRGINYAHIVENYSREAADDIRRKFPGVVNKEGGLGADVVCNDVGFESGDALIYALADADPRGKRISDLAERIMREQDEATMPDQAVAASESYGLYLEKFQAALSKTIRKATYSPREYLRRAAKDYAMALKVRDATRYDTHQHTMRQQMQARLEAARNNDTRAELFALEKLRLAHEMAGEAVRAREQVDSLAKRVGRIVKTKSMESQFRDQVLSLSERFGLGMAGPRNPEHLVPLATLLQGQVDDFGWAVSFPDWLVNGTARADYRDLTMAEFSHLENLVKHLEKRGRDEHRESKESYIARIGNLVQATIAPSAAMKPKHVFAENSVLHSLTGEARSFFASLDSLQFLFRSFDGYSNVGPEGTKGANERLLWNAIVDGSNARKRLVKEIKTELEPHLGQLRKSARAWEKQHGKRLNLPGVVIPASWQRIGRGWSADAVITMALHMGSESNLARLRTGYPDLNSHTIETLTGLLSEADWDAVQGIGKVFEAQWSKLDEVHFKINGFHMQRIQAREFMPVGLERQGILKKYPGWYFPAIYDPEQSRFMREVSEAGNIMAQVAQFDAPSAKKGMTQSRKDKAPGLPLLLSTSTIMKHVSDVATYVTLAAPVREADRVTRDSAYESAFTRVLGRDAYDQIRPALKGIVRPEPAGNSFLDRFVEKARSYATPFYLAWNFKTMLSQFLSAPRGMHDIGVRNYARGLKIALTENPLEKIAWIRGISQFMDERAVSRDRELAQMLKKMDVTTKSFGVFGKDFTWENAVNVGFTPMIVADWLTAYPIWLGKYEAELEKNGGDMQSAVLAADDAVRFSQSTANAEDMSDFLRSGAGVKRLLSMFGTDNIGRYGQRQRYHWRAWRAGKMTATDYAWFNVCDAILPAVGMRILMELFWKSQVVPDDDDDKRWLDFLGDVFGDIFLQGVPLAGSLVSSWRKPLDSPVGTLVARGKQSVKAVGKLAADVDDEEAQEKALLGIAELLSIYSKVPVSQIVNRARRGHEQYEDGDGATPFVYLVPEPKK